MSVARSMRTIVLIAAVGVSALPAGAVASTVAVPLSKDTTIFSEDGTLGNGAGPNLFAGSNNRAATVRRSLLAFDLSGILPVGAHVESVDLALQVDRESTAVGFAVSLHRLTNNWGEGLAASVGGQGAPATPGDATWSSRFFGTADTWAAAGGDFAAAASATTLVGGNGIAHWSSAAMVADVQAWLAQPATNFGWLLLGDESQSGTAKRFVSGEGTAAGLAAPMLTVTFTSPVPEPSAYLLLLASLPLVLGAASLRRMPK